MNLYFYDYSGDSLSELGFTDRILSARAELAFNDVSSFEYHLSIQNPLLNMLISNKYMLVYQTDCEHELWSVVVGVTASEDITVYCRSLNWFLKKAVVPKLGTDKVSVDAKVEEILMGNELIYAGDIPTISNEIYYYTDKYTQMLDCVKGALSLIGGGHRVRLNTADGPPKLLLDVFERQECDIIISTNDGTAKTLSRSWDVLDYFNGGYYEKVTTENETEVKEWAEISPTQNPLISWYTVLSGENESEAKKDLSEKKEKSEVKAELQRLSYGDDYHLGDIVTVQIENDSVLFTKEMQINKVVLNWDEKGFTEKPTLEETTEPQEGVAPESEEEVTE